MREGGSEVYAKSTIKKIPDSRAAKLQTVRYLRSLMYPTYTQTYDASFERSLDVIHGTV